MQATGAAPRRNGGRPIRGRDNDVASSETVIDLGSEDDVEIDLRQVLSSSAALLEQLRRIERLRLGIVRG
jgi:hypothetical protein